MFTVQGYGKCQDEYGRLYSNILVSSFDFPSLSQSNTISTVALDTCGDICLGISDNVVGFAYTAESAVAYCFCYFDKEAALPTLNSYTALAYDSGEGQVRASDGRANHICYKYDPPLVSFGT